MAFGGIAFAGTPGGGTATSAAVDAGANLGGGCAAGPCKTMEDDNGGLTANGNGGASGLCFWSCFHGRRLQRRRRLER